jgi:hypothetical protein
MDQKKTSKKANQAHNAGHKGAVIKGDITNPADQLNPNEHEHGAKSLNVGKGGKGAKGGNK